MNSSQSLSFFLVKLRDVPKNNTSEINLMFQESTCTCKCNKVDHLLSHKRFTKNRRKQCYRRIKMLLSCIPGLKMMSYCLSLSWVMKYYLKAEEKPMWLQKQKCFSKSRFKMNISHMWLNLFFFGGSLAQEKCEINLFSNW